VQWTQSKRSMLRGSHGRLGHRRPAGAVHDCWPTGASEQMHKADRDHLRGPDRLRGPPKASLHQSCTKRTLTEARSRTATRAHPFAAPTSGHICCSSPLASSNRSCSAARHEHPPEATSCITSARRMDGVALPLALVVSIVASEAGTPPSRAQAVDHSHLGCLARLKTPLPLIVG
jgi:hypothetical protein